MNTRIALSLLLTFALLWFTACGIGDQLFTRHFVLEQPLMLSPWPRIEAFEIEAIVEGGVHWRVRINPGATLTLEVAPGLYAAVLARPLLEGGVIEPVPAGLVINPLEEGGRLKLSWESGPAAAFMKGLIEGGLPRGLNTGRLLERLRGIGYDAWGIDLGMLASEARAAKLGLSDFRGGQKIDVVIDAGLGLWRFDCPAGPLAIAGEDGRLCASLFPGYHVLAGDGGAGSGWLGTEGEWTWISPP